MDGRDADREKEARAHELYWSSELSVNQIAEELDVSKGMLYGMVRPLPTACACPECGEEVCYPNRTARDKGLVACAACGWEGSEDEAEGFAAGAGLELPTYESPASDDGKVWSSARTRTLVGGALLGAAAGLALVFWSRRR